MTTCIYCLQDKPSHAFQPEHVLPRAFCGQGTNWTLTSAVCSDCNRHFSRYEAHWLRQAFEAMARNFQGPVSRNDPSRFDRLQPVEIDDIYILMKNDPLVYEAGFAFPNDPHFRPQMIDTGRALMTLVGRHEDIDTFQRRVSDLIRSRFIDITVPIWRRHHEDWLIASIDRLDTPPTYRLAAWRREQTPSGLWLRSYPHDNFLSQRSLPDTHFTARLALDHRGRLYLRAANLDAAIAFLKLLHEPPAEALPRPDLAPGDQTVAFSFTLDFAQIFKAVLKTGINLYCYFFGAEAALAPYFQPVRDILLKDLKDEDGASLALRCCQLDPHETSDFPRAKNPDQHRMQLDLTEKGILRFRLRLYNSIGYHAHLAVLPLEMKRGFRTRRVAVDFADTGIREVITWDD